jgi:ring-1,2-phenylacetyl-CoA epoxidase subunit PaaE
MQTTAVRAPTFHSLVVSDVRRDTEDAVVITFAVPAELGEEYRFLHGQHVTLRRIVDGEDVRRSYSICSAAGGPLRVAVRRVAGGRLSCWLNDELTPGDRIDVMTPAGRFTSIVDRDAVHSYGAVAAGSGITPVLSIIETLLRDECRSQVSLLYVNRTMASTMFVEELEALRNRYVGRLRLWYVFTREPGEVAIVSGRPDTDRLAELVALGVLDADAHAFFLCGPEDLVASTRTALQRAGVPADRVHVELFGTRNAPTRRLAAAAPSVATGAVVLHGRTTTFDLRDGETILGAALRQRPDLPYSCLSGVCSTCRASLREGDVTMDVCFGLEPTEVADGYVLTCQSRPRTGHVVVDFDT